MPRCDGSGGSSSGIIHGSTPGGSSLGLWKQPESAHHRAPSSGVALTLETFLGTGAGRMAARECQKPSGSPTKMACTRSGATTRLMIRTLFTPLGTPYASRARRSSNGKQYS